MQMRYEHEVLHMWKVLAKTIDLVYRYMKIEE